MCAVVRMRAHASVKHNNYTFDGCVGVAVGVGVSQSVCVVAGVVGGCDRGG